MTKRTTLQCPNCGTPNQVVIETVIDPAHNSDAKSMLLSNRLNTMRCSQCGTVSSMAAPLLYHDASKELLLTYVPMELGLSKDQSERTIGDMMKELTSTLKPEQMRGYLFQPRQMLTVQGMIDTILQADGVTSEMMDAQRQRIRLIEELLNTPPDLLESRVTQIDAQVDEPFIQLITVMAQRVAGEGQVPLAEALMGLQEALLQYTTFGKLLIEQAAVQQQIVQEVANDLNGLADASNGAVSREAFVDLIISYAEDDQREQAVVGLARRALDETFFALLDTRVEGAEGDEQTRLSALRDRLHQLTQIIDQQAQMAVQESAALLQALLAAPDIDAALEQSMQMLDDTFMAVLAANIQEAERRTDIQSAARLKNLYEKVLSTMRNSMPTELRFINELLSAETPEVASARVRAEAPQYGPVLLDMLASVEQAMAERGDGVLLQRLQFLRQEIEAALA